MSDLDKKLEKVIVAQLQEYRSTGKPISEVVSAVKQTFIDAGYVKPNPEQLEDLFKIIEKRFGRLMTGQEWYEQFKQICDSDDEIWHGVAIGEFSRDVSMEVYNRVLRAAKKAAGMG